MNKSRITYLIERYLNDTATAQELDELESVLADPDADRMIKTILRDSYYHLPEVTGNHSDSEAKERIFQQIVTQSQQQTEPAKRITERLLKWLPYAAAIVIVAAIGLLIWNNKRPSHQEIAAAEIYPGANGATLSLADGRTIALDHTQGGIKVGAGEITYSDGHSPILKLGDGGEPVEKLMLSTPKGGTYTVTLPDGSRVWLNTASTLTYPSQFNDAERVVHLEGEAYFSVNKRPGKSRETQEIPFKVVSNGQVVQVLGTEFNISAYADEPEVQTTLVEGRVRVSVDKGAATGVSKHATTTLLEPGEQAINRAGVLDVQAVDPNQYTAWKDGLFYFERSPPQVAIAQLARWYDLEVVYQGKTPQVNIFGVIDRNKSLGSVLKSLEKSGLRFRVVHVNGVNQLIVLGEH
ncbi:iron dicitrate transporter FecR [Parapedobacter defluvii]|uniref:Iron dicitrate transporter FecR n=1 Tax=Parapedobacter defluvii TaxID=2045106 RepID=A0ABQ1MUJ8_9SPHI|nr:FecR family protein [Parapedobacter defluvii]GGC47208.1 iron dicitrate transporter FecR [Parapedobacter defluvii]